MRLVVAFGAVAVLGFVDVEGTGQVAVAATVGSGICEQTVDSTTGINVEQSGSDCLITFSNGWSLSNPWSPPSGIAGISFVVAGSAGSSASRSGDGGRVTGSLDLSSSPGSNLHIGVGSWGAAADIRLGGTATSSRIVVAGAGGDCGRDDDGTCGSSGAGGHGGGTQTGASPSRTVTGQDGSTGSASGAGGGRGGGTSGGSGGAGATGGQCGPTPAGGSGALGAGGAGGRYVACGYGGDGGDGFYGGGGGGANSTHISGSSDPGGGGGGGSSYTSSTYVPEAGLVYERGVNSSTGTVVLSYTPRSAAMQSEPSGSSIGLPLDVQPAVALTEGGTGSEGVTVSVTIGSSPSPSGTQMTPVLDGTVSATTDAGGVASFTNLAIRGPAGSYTLTFTATGYPDVTSASFTLGVGSATSLAVTTEPTGGSSGGSVTGSPAVSIVDAGGNVVTTDSATTVTATSSTGTIGGTTSVTAVAGVATFDGLTLAGDASINHAISFSADGLAGDSTADFTITHGSGSSLSIATQPVGGVGIGSALATQPVVNVVDAEGNVVSSDSSTVVTATISSGSASATLSNRTATASSGVVTFAGMAVDGAGGQFTIEFTADGLTSVLAEPVSIDLTPQTITFTYSGGSVAFGDDPFAVEASTSPSQLPIAFTSTTPAVCEVVGDDDDVAGTTAATVTILGAGTCTIDADQAGDETYGAATTVSESITISKASQSAVTLVNASTITYGDSLMLVATGGSGTGDLSFALSGGAGTANCSLDSSTGELTVSAAGSCGVTATRAGDSNHESATSAAQTITVDKATQVLEFTTTVPAEPLPGGEYEVAASADSGLSVTLGITTGDGSACSLSGGTVSFLAAGTCVITASQAGDGNYEAASSVTQSIEVGSLNQSISFIAVSDMAIGDPSVSITASASSALPVTVTSQTVSVCTVSGSSVTAVAVGRCSLTASQAGDDRYAAASSVTRSFDVVPGLPTAPTIATVSAGSGAVTIGITDPGFTGGVDIDGYQVVATPAGGGSAITDSSCIASPCTIRGLTNGTEYTLTAAAINAAGTGAASVASPTITPYSRPLAVGGLAGVPGDGTLAVSWDRISDGGLGGGTFTGYQVTLTGDDSPVVESITDRDTVTHTFSDLANGVTYEVEVVTLTSVNATAVVGTTATLSAIPAVEPSAPAQPSASLTSPLEATISWSEPVSNGGVPITSYTVTITAQTVQAVQSLRSAVATAANPTCSTPVIDPVTRVGSCMITGLAAGMTYTVTVTANNRAGSSPAASVTLTTASYPAPSEPTSSDDSCESCATDSSGESVPTSSTSTAVGSPNGSIEVTDGVVAVELGGADGTSVTVDADGRLALEAPGSLRLTGSGLLPTTSVVVWWDTTELDSITVPASGAIEIDIDSPDDAASGPVVLRVDVVGSTGAQRLFRFPISVLAAATDTGPADADPAVSDDSTVSADPTSNDSATTLDTSSSNSLPTTGRTGVPLAWLVLLLAAGGLVVLLADGRRRLVNGV